jgi:cytochrome c oxidase subunit I+III
LLTLKLVVAALICGIIAVAMIMRWLWETDPGPDHPPVDIGGGLKLPTYLTGPDNHSWWAMVVLLLVGGTLFTCLVFSYLFLWMTSIGRPWVSTALPALQSPALAALLYAFGSAAIATASRLLKAVPTRSAWPMRLTLVLAVAFMVGAFAIDLLSHLQTGLRPQQTAYAAAVYMVISLQGTYVVTLVIMTLYTIARSLAGKLDGARRSTFDNTALLWHFATGQAVAGLALVALFPRLVGS